MGIDVLHVHNGHSKHLLDGVIVFLAKIFLQIQSLLLDLINVHLNVQVLIMNKANSVLHQQKTC